MKAKRSDGMTERQAARIIEIFENGARNGEEWAHDVCLHRGTEKYEKSLDTLNEAFKIKCMNRIVEPFPEQKVASSRKR